MRKISLCLCVAVVVLAARQARAAEYFTSYSITVDIGQPITNILMFEVGESYGSVSWAFTASGNGTTVLEQIFSAPVPIESSLLIGIVTGLAGDANPEQKHVVLCLDNTAAALSEHIAWGTLFRNTLEEDLIAAIELATSGQDFPIIEPGLNAVSAFAEGDAKTGILGPGGIPQSAWFSTGGAFTVMTWSEGQIIGSGTSTVVPEPATLALLATAGLLVPRRRR